MHVLVHHAPWCTLARATSLHPWQLVSPFTSSQLTQGTSLTSASGIFHVQAAVWTCLLLLGNHLASLFGLFLKFYEPAHRTTARVWMWFKELNAQVDGLHATVQRDQSGPGRPWAAWSAPAGHPTILPRTWSQF